MLYVTTRSSRDAYTPYRAMTEDFAADGGQFLPMQVPCLTAEELENVARRSFNENVAAVLRLLCRKNLTGRDIDLAVGKFTAPILELNSRTLVAELWRNLDCSFEEYVLRLFRLIVKEPQQRPGSWFIMSVRIAQLFGLFGELMAKGMVSSDTPLDISVPSFDFQYPMAAWYARSWGLPIGTIICCCNENNAPWSLLHQGEMRTDNAVRHTHTAACDQAVPAGLERLIHAVLGTAEAGSFASACSAGQLYSLTQDQQTLLRQGLSVSVVSQRRMEFMLPNIYRENRWQPEPYAAMAYAGLVDHRAAPGDTGSALIIAEENPVCRVEMLAEMLRMEPDKLRLKLENR